MLLGLDDAATRVLADAASGAAPAPDAVSAITRFAATPNALALLAVRTALLSP